MSRIKLLIIALFAICSLIGFGTNLFSPTATGQSGSDLSSPTGVNASDGAYINKVSIMWDTIRGATTYNIFRGTTNNPAAAVSIGTTPAPFFFDTTAPAGQNFFYWVRAENGSNVSNLSPAEPGFRANGTLQGGNGPLDPPPPAPPGNPLTATKVYLGKALFWDEQLSSTKTVSCGSCHQANKGGSDIRSIVSNTRSTNAGADNVFGTPDDVYGSPGVPLSNADGSYGLSNIYGMKEQVTSRKSNSVLNAAYFQVLFWDGRATFTFRDPITNAIVLNGGAALESQAAGPPVSSAEMGHGGRNWSDVAARVAASKPLALSPSVPTALQTWINGRNYQELFQEAYGSPDVTPSKIIMAIATYERTLFTDRAVLDDVAGGIGQLTAEEQRGRGVFNQAQCNICHGGSLLTDNNFHYIGLRPQGEDTGRFQVTGNANNIGEFKTPSLRNVELRAPYMHNGRFATLEEVVEFYNRGGDFQAPNFPGNLIRPRNLSTQQKSDLVAFLKRPLTDPRVLTQTAPFDRPTLYAESNRVPVVSGTGRAGTGGVVPQVVAIEPPIAGNTGFTVGLSSGLGNRQAVLVIDANDPGIGTTIPASGSFARVTVNLSGTGTGNGFGSTVLSIPNSAALIGKTFFGRWYVTDEGAANGFSVSQSFRFTIFGEAATPTRAKHADFDGDGKADISVFRPNDGNWYILNSSNNGFSATNFGLSGDVITPADYDGDGKADISVYRNGIWYLLRSRDGFTAIQFGLTGDRPQPGDYDGDGRADIAVWRPSDRVWYIQKSTDGFTSTQFGLSTDRPVAADYDGDGKTDIAIYRDGVWYMLRSTAGFTALQFGTAEDKPVIGDYDNDTKADLAVWRPSAGVWYTLRSSDGGFRAVQYGISTDIPTPGDYDGDGVNDYAVFRPSEGNWYIIQSSSNTTRVQNFGLSVDIPAPSSIVP